MPDTVAPPFDPAAVTLTTEHGSTAPDPDALALLMGLQAASALGIPAGEVAAPAALDAGRAALAAAHTLASAEAAQDAPDPCPRTAADQYARDVETGNEFPRDVRLVVGTFAATLALTLLVLTAAGVIR